GLGRIRERQGHWQQAGEFYARALNLAPDYRDVQKAGARIKNAVRPEAGLKAVSAGERERDKESGRDVIALQEDVCMGEFLWKWSPKHKTGGRVMVGRKSEKNLVRDAFNYRVGQSLLGLNHAAHWENWLLRGWLGWSGYLNDGTHPFGFSGPETFMEWALALTYGLGNHRLTTEYSHDDLLVKDFQNSGLQLLGIDAVGLVYSLSPGPSWLTLLSARMADYAGENWRIDLEGETGWALPWIPAVNIAGKWRYRKFQRDVAKYYSYDNQHRLEARLAGKKTLFKAIEISGRYIYSHEITSEEVNPGIKYASAPVMETELMTTGGHELRLGMGWVQWKRSRMGLEWLGYRNSDDYRTQGIFLNGNLRF
ncbi:hypothetical protein ACFL5V_12705, partial [Fibrobacterota bacterium]